VADTGLWQGDGSFGDTGQDPSGSWGENPRDGDMGQVKSFPYLRVSITFNNFAQILNLVPWRPPGLHKGGGSRPVPCPRIRRCCHIWTSLSNWVSSRM